MIRKILNNSFVLFVIFIVIAIIIPLPSWLLDFLILLNISLSLIILVMTMFIREALEFSVFPTVLLLTTVLRLSLNVSTTRGLHSSGYAGSVIAAFGQFVMGGDAIVGFLTRGRGVSVPRADTAPMPAHHRRRAQQGYPLPG